MIRAGRPSVAADLARARQGVPLPQDLARLGVECGQAATHPEFAAGDAAIDDAVEIERRASDAIAVMPVLDRSAPNLLAGLDVERHDIGIELAGEQQPLAHR